MRKLQSQGVHHITLVGADRQTSIDFWEGVLGMPFVFEQPNLDRASESHLYFDPGDGRLITIFTDDSRAADPARTSTDPGAVHHIAFSVSRVTFLQAVERLDFGEVRGFMKGYIDLVFESGGRFYLLDYKSNWLGDQLTAYGRPQMAQVMLREHYYLQYLFYTLALHRYLRNRMPGYRYDSHFGAVLYLFLRGVDPVAGGESGIYRERPDAGLIEALDDFIGHPGGVPL